MVRAGLDAQSLGMTGSTRALTPAERRAWLRLIRSENVGPATFFELLRRFGDADAALRALPDLARRGGRQRPLRLAAVAEIDAELDRLDRHGARAVAACEPDYPPLLRALDDAPPVLAIKGHAALASRATVALVGARNASAVALKLARDMAGDLGRSGYAVVSGLARGVDTAAHRGALETGTIAVVAGGIDIVYPPENAELQAQIGETGLVIAEMPAGTEPQARHFPRRNRLISGLSRGIVVVEAALKSGSLISARFAAEQGREVMAVPGSPLDPRARGANDLIRNGATLVEGADDVIRALAHWQGGMAEPGDDQTTGTGAPPVRQDERALADARAKVSDLLGYTPIETDELIRLTALPAQTVAIALLELELAGRLRRAGAGKVLLAEPE